MCPRAKKLVPTAIQSPVTIALKQALFFITSIILKKDYSGLEQKSFVYKDMVLLSIFIFVAIAQQRNLASVSNDAILVETRTIESDLNIGGNQDSTVRIKY